MNFKETIDKVVKTAKDNEKFVIAGLVYRANNFAKDNKSDSSVIMAMNILNNMEKNNRDYISRKELNSIYESVYSPGTSLGELFAKELDRGGTVKTAQVYDRQKIGSSEDFDSIVDSIGDRKLKNSLASFWDDGVVKTYSKESAELAKKACRDKISTITNVKDVSIFSGTDKVIFCKANIFTTKGMVDITVPVEIINEKVLEPSTFVVGETLKELNAEVLESHLEEGFKRQSDYQNYYETLPKVEIRTPETDAYAKNYDYKYADAADCYGKKLVDSTLELVAHKLRDFGFQVQAAVAGIEPGVLIVAASLNKDYGVRVPVKIVNDLPLEPTIALASGEIERFSKDGIVRLLKTADLDKDALAIGSKYGGASIGELIEIVKEAADNHNWLKAQDAMSVLSKNPEAYKIAMDILLLSLQGEDSQVDAKVAEASSLPLDGFCTHKVLLW